ncbi:MAG: Zn-dependent hydrolase [Acidobacteriia bacterium]|nr:Zn-dependent hydrolase [Terriglobia bacterium]
MRPWVYLVLVIFLAGCSVEKNRESAGKLVVAPDLDQRLAKWRQVEMPFDSARLNAHERQLVEKLVEASQYLDDIYWRQSDPEALDLYKSLAGKSDIRDQGLRRFLMINGSRFDLLDENRPFVGTQPMPPGGVLYPPGLTRAEIEAYVQAHPGQKDAIYSPTTVIRREGGQLQTVAYHEAYHRFLGPAADALREAAGLTDDAAFAKFLRLRAEALLDDDYYPSDLAWLDLKNPKFDVIMAPYETYLDGVLGVKGSYGAAVLIRNDAESRRLELYEKYIPSIQDALPLPAADRPSKRGHLTPMEVMDTPFRGGDLRHGYQAVADNLPNDPKIHQEKGTKKIFFKNFMDARVNDVILPLAKFLLRGDQAAKVSGEGYMAGTILHEISHGLGPAFARVGGKQVDIREALGPSYSGWEEAKADAVGMFGLKWLVDHGALPRARLEEYYASYIAGIFRTLRYGTGEAHGRAEMMEFNYLAEQKAVARDSGTGRYVIDYALMPTALAKLAQELLVVEATGDRARAEAWLAKYDKMPAELVAALQSGKAVPVDIDPIFAFPEKVE